MARPKKNMTPTTGSESEEDLLEYFKKELGSKIESDFQGFISTGSTWLDYCIANKAGGGVPIGRVVEICGNEASGKSLIAYHILANTQKMGGLGVYIDIERAKNVEFMTRMGIDVDKLICPKKIPDTIEDVFEYIEKVVKITQLKFPNKDKPVTIVWDSVAATMAKETVEQRYGEGRITPEARAMSDCFKRSMPMLDMGYVTLVCINQLRTKVGVMFGDPEITPHGKALPFYASVRIKLTSSMKHLKDESGRVIGVSTTAKVFKNKVGPSHRSCKFNVMFDWGIDDAPSLFTYMKDTKYLTTSGAWRTWIHPNGEEFRFQDSDGTSEWRKLYKEYRKEILKQAEEQMIIKFERPPETYSIDTESVMEIEQIKDDIKHG